MLKCNACGGTYQATQPDGAQYFHVCPPLSDAEIATLLALPADPATWTKPQQAQAAATSRVRSNGRDENLPGTRSTDTGKLKAPGKGTTMVADPILPAPLVLP